MAGKKISELNELLSLDLSGVTAIVTSGSTYKISYETIKSDLIDDAEHTFTENQEIIADLNITGTTSISGNLYVNGLSVAGSTDVTYDELVTLISTSGLTPNVTYRLTDYQTVHYFFSQEGRLNDGYTGSTEPLILSAISNCEIKSEAFSELYPYDNIKYDWDPNNWLKDIGFANTDTSEIIPGFKGVIYYRHDTLNDNLLPYDFRNVKFRRWKPGYPIWDSGTTYNAWSQDHVQFTGITGIFRTLINNNINNDPRLDRTAWAHILSYSASEYYESSINNAMDENDYIDIFTFNCPGGESQYNKVVRSNTFLLAKENGSIPLYMPSILLNNVFHLNSGEDYLQVTRNEFAPGCYYNTMGSYFIQNKTMGIFINNKFGDFHYFNIFGNSFQNNILYDMCYYNDFGGDFKYNGVSQSCYYNIFGISFTDNVFSQEFQDNIIGNLVNNNSFGESFKHNVIQNSFIQNFIGSYCFYNTFGSGIKRLQTPDKDEEYSFRNNRICDGVTSGSTIDLSNVSELYYDVNCIIYLIPDGSIRVEYKDNNDVDVIKDLDGNYVINNYNNHPNIMEQSFIGMYVLTQAEYDAIGDKDASTIYFIKSS